MSTLRSLVLSLVVLLLALVGVDLLFVRYVRGHFLPEQTMRTAVAQGNGCIVFVGDSRMVAGVDLGIAADRLRRSGHEACVASVAVGAVPLSGMMVSLREYLLRGPVPHRVVLGVTIDTLLRAESPGDPTAFVGNDAIELGWSQLGDLRRHFPAGWLEDPGAFDRRFRFLTTRSSALGAYGSLVWRKVQEAQDRIAGRPRAAHNVFGAVSDMNVRARELEHGARERLQMAIAWADAKRLDPWFLDMQALLAARQIPLAVVSVPMPASFQLNVTSTPEAKRFGEWLARWLGDRGSALIDFSAPTWLRPQLFADDLHLNTEGAAQFSADLATQLAELESRQPAR